MLPLTFGNRRVILSQTLLGTWLHINAGTKYQSTLIQWVPGDASARKYKCAFSYHYWHYYISLETQPSTFPYISIYHTHRFWNDIHHKYVWCPTINLHGPSHVHISDIGTRLTLYAVRTHVINSRHKHAFFHIFCRIVYAYLFEYKHVSP